MIRVLFVEDDYVARENLALEFRQAGLEVLEERLSAATLQSLNRWAPDVLLLAIGEPPGERGGMEFLSRLRFDALWRHLPVIVLSRLGNLRNLDVMTLGIRAVVAPPEATGKDVAWWIRAAIPSRAVANGELEGDRRAILLSVGHVASRKPHRDSEERHPAEEGTRETASRRAIPSAPSAAR
jgi:CheY-like chemotaxis protein